MSPYVNLISDHRCPGSSRTCDQRLEGMPEFTWSIVAAGDLREERNERTEKKAGSPQGWEEGKNEGITFPRCTGISFFNKLFQSTTSHTLILSAHVELYEECNHPLLCSVLSWQAFLVLCSGYHSVCFKLPT